MKKHLASIALVAAGLLVGSSAFAAAGDIVRTQYSNTYLLATGSSRLAFPDDLTVRSWGDPAATTVEENVLSRWQVSGVVPIREGYTLVKFGTDPDVFAVSPGGILHKLATPAVAATLYGPGWQQHIVSLFSSYWANYRIGTALTEATYPDGTLFRYPDRSTVYYLTSGVARPFQSKDAFLANHFSFDSVLTVPRTLKYVAGNVITGYEADLDMALSL